MNREQLLTPFLDAFGNVLATMAMMECSAVGAARVKTDDCAAGTVTGLMDLTCPQLRLTLAISFSRPVLLDIMARLFGEDQPPSEEEMADLVGELTNMTTGGAKRTLAEAGYDFDLSVPEVLCGDQHRIEHPAGGTTLIQPLTTACGEIFLELNYVPA